MNILTTVPLERPWCCPECGSTTLRVFYSERRTCGVITGPGGADHPYPWPSYAPDEFVDIDPDSFDFRCDKCGAVEIAPTQHDPARGAARVERQPTSDVREGQ